MWKSSSWESCFQSYHSTLKLPFPSSPPRPLERLLALPRSHSSRNRQPHPTWYSPPHPQGSRLPHPASLPLQRRQQQKGGLGVWQAQEASEAGLGVGLSTPLFWQPDWCFPYTGELIQTTGNKLIPLHCIRGFPPSEIFWKHLRGVALGWGDTITTVPEIWTARPPHRRPSCLYLRWHLTPRWRWVKTEPGEPWEPRGSLLTQP